MKKLAILAAVASLMIVASCATNTATNFINTQTSGNWEARLTGGAGPASQLNFITSFIVVDSGPLSFTSSPYPVSFFNAGACFGTGENVVNASGSANLTTNSGTGQVTGSMNLTVQSTTNSSVLTLTAQPPNGGVSGTSNGTVGTTGTLSNGVAWGTWSLTGATGCTGSGSFTMCQGQSTCTIP